jgi:hypothetical protein
MHRQDAGTTENPKFTFYYYMSCFSLKEIFMFFWTFLTFWVLVLEQLLCMLYVTKNFRYLFYDAQFRRHGVIFYFQLPPIFGPDGSTRFRFNFSVGSSLYIHATVDKKHSWKGWREKAGRARIWVTASTVQPCTKCESYTCSDSMLYFQSSLNTV